MGVFCEEEGGGRLSNQKGKKIGLIFLSPPNSTYCRFENRRIFLGRIKFFSILLLRAGNLNPDCLILIFNLLNPLFLDKVQKKQKPVFKIRQSLPFLYINPKWREKISNFPASDTLLCLVEFYTLFRIQEQDQVSHEIKKKRGSSIDLDSHHSKVSSSDESVNLRFTVPWSKKK